MGRDPRGDLLDRRNGGGAGFHDITGFGVGQTMLQRAKGQGRGQNEL